MQPIAISKCSKSSGVPEGRAWRDMPFIVRFYFPATGEIAPSVNEVKVVSETIVMSCRDMDVHHVLAAFVEWYALLRSTGFRLLVTGCFCRVQEDSRQPTSTVRPRTLGIDVQRKCCAVLVSKFLLVARGFSRVYLLVCCAKKWCCAVEVASSAGWIR